MKGVINYLVFKHQIREFSKQINQQQQTGNHSHKQTQTLSTVTSGVRGSKLTAALTRLCLLCRDSSECHARHDGDKRAQVQSAVAATETTTTAS